MLSSDYQKLDAAGIITLYELDATTLGADILRWHGHVGYEDWERIYYYAGSSDELAGDNTELAGQDYGRDDTPTIRKNIVWQGDVYSPIAIQSDGLEMRGDGKASMPTLVLANNIDGIQNAVFLMCMQFDDFAGAKLTVINTFAKYLDAVNFTDGNTSASDECEKQIWFIEQKTSANAAQVTFELSNPVDFAGRKIPCREITSHCHWCVHGRYRGEECGYTGTSMFDSSGNAVSSRALDRCGGRLYDCKLRRNEQRFGGFPASRMVD